MNRLTKICFAWCMMLVLLLSTVSFGASAGEAAYASHGDYIYNWGIRGEPATFLSTNAKAFYDAYDTSYEILSSYMGGTGQADAPNSALYQQLQALMTNAHTYINDYAATRDLFQYTDCQNGGGTISSFYSGKEIGPSWDGGWNREHTWPNSKGLAGSDEDDLMMLRPTSISENSSRGNTAYGKSSGYYNPNSESNGEYDLRGDVARISLYVYVRWGNQTYAWGTSGVMESMEVLLEWMEADPVDTWEMGRNDSVESITGTRNVFVDYPELAFLLFGQEIPEDMTTPSGGDGQDCGHNNFDAGVVIAATCVSKGYTLYTCMTEGCDYRYKANVTVPTGHHYTVAVTEPTCTHLGYTTYTCSVCQSSYVGDHVPTVPHSYQNNTCTVCGATKGAAAEVTLSFENDSCRTYLSKTQQVWSKDGIVVTNNKSSATSDVASYVNPVRFYSGSSITVEAGGSITKIVFDCNSNSYASVLQKSIGNAAMLSADKVTVELDGSSDTYTVARLTAQVRVDSITVFCAEASEACRHANFVVDQAVAPTCTKTGLTEGTHCTDCGETLVAQQTVAALGHSEETVPGKDATCTEEGLTSGKKCMACGTVIVAQETISAKGHIHGEWVVVKQATATEDGLQEKTCACGDKISEVIPATGEVTSPGQETTTPEETTPGDETVVPEETTSEEETAAPGEQTTSVEITSEQITPPEATTAEQEQGGSCSGVLHGGVLAFVLMLASALIARKRED